jgi:hypothetical protein
MIVVMGETKRIYIKDLRLLIDREIGTIRGWERSGILPKKLRPRRDERRWRYWTPAQVTGIQEWMKKNDMRPGPALAKPENEARHLKNLRQPKLLKPALIRRAYNMAKKGKTQLEIADELYEVTKYKDEEAFLRALSKAFKIRGWKMPPRDEEARKRREEAKISRSAHMTARHIVAKELGTTVGRKRKSPDSQAKVKKQHQ